MASKKSLPKLMNSLRHSGLEDLAAALAAGALMELRLTPKPGLVDLMDSGSHPDLSVPLMEQSIGIVAQYLEEIVVSLRAEEPFVRQKEIAIRAEGRLYTELGTNTHKGYIFLSGMLLIARWHAASSDEPAVRATLSNLSSRFFATHEEKLSHGGRARREFHAGGIVAEAIKGFPSLFDHALPAYRSAMQRHDEVKTASFAMLARLMQTVEDTTTLHRAGPEGLALVRERGHELEQRVAAGNDYLP